MPGNWCPKWCRSHRNWWCPEWCLRVAGRIGIGSVGGGVAPQSCWSQGIGGVQSAAGRRELVMSKGGAGRRGISGGVTVVLLSLVN